MSATTQLVTVPQQFHKKLFHTHKSPRRHSKNLEKEDKTSSSSSKTVTLKTRQRRRPKKKNKTAKKRPRKKSASLKRRRLLVAVVPEKSIEESSQQSDEAQNPVLQQHIQFFLQSTSSPQASPVSSNSEMSTSGTNNYNIYRGRGDWSPFHRNSYAYEGNRRRRSHLDDVYLPNYDDDELERRNGFNQQRYHSNRFYWNRKNPSQRYDHRNISNRTLVDTVQLREHHRNDSSESRNNNSFSYNTAPSSGTSVSTDIVTNRDTKVCEAVKANDVNSNSKTELPSESTTSKDVKYDNLVSCNKLNDCGNSVAQCHNSEKNLKTADSCQSNLENVSLNKSNSDPSEETQDKTEMTKELHRFLNSLDRYVEKSETSETCEDEHENPLVAAAEIESEEEIDGLDDFITIDNIDTAKSYLKPSPTLLDQYEVIDMDISPMKRKSDSDEEEEEEAKKARYDSLYFKMNSDKLLNEINEVLKETESSGSPKIEIYKRFRSKSLSLHKDAMENSPVVRSLSIDSVNKSEFQVSFNFDLKTNLLLLLKQNSTQKEVSGDFSSILKVLLGDDEKLAANNISSVSDESKNVENAATAKEGKESDPQVAVEEKDNFETCNNQLDQKKPEATNCIETKSDVPFCTRNNVDEKENVEEKNSASLDTQSVIGNEQIGIKKVPDFRVTSKRKNSVDHEEQSKKIRLNPVGGNDESSKSHSTDKSELMTEKQFSKGNSNPGTSPKEFDEFIINNDIESIPLCNKTITKDICEESLVDIEEELKSLLAVDVPNKEQKKISPENKKQEVVPNDDKVNAIVNINDKIDTNKELLKKDTSSNTKSMESCNTNRSKQSSEKESRKTDPQKGREKPTKNRSSTNSLHSRSKGELTRKRVAIDKTKHEKPLKIFSSVEVITSSSQLSLNKSVVVELESQKRQNLSGSKTVSYYERFKRIQLLFGSDSEGETEEEMNSIITHSISGTHTNKETKKLGISKLNTNLPRNKPSSAKESTKVIEKRRFSAPITGPPLKSVPSTICKPKPIEKKRRETLPASLSGKNSKLHLSKDDQAQKSTEDKNDKRDKDEKVSVINHKLKDPRKEHYRYKSLGRNKPKKEIHSANKLAVGSNLLKTHNKNIDKNKPHHKTEKKDIASNNLTCKVVNENTKKIIYDKNNKNKPKELGEKNCMLKEENLTIETIINHLQLQTELSNVGKNSSYVKTDVPKKTRPPKVDVEKVLQLRNGTQERTQLKLQQCAALPQDRFPMLQRASPCVQENDCCDKAVTLEKVDVNDKIDIVVAKQKTKEEDDVIEVKEYIPVIDLTEDNLKEEVCDTLKVKLEEKNEETVNKSNEMITLYRSEETVNSSLDVQVTSETISPEILRNKENLGHKSLSPSSNNPKTSASPPSYISPLAKESSPAQFTFNVTASVSNNTQIQPGNSLTSSLPTVSQTVRPLVNLSHQVNRENVKICNNTNCSCHQANRENVKICNNTKCSCNLIQTLAPQIPVQVKPQQNPIPPPPPYPLAQPQTKIDNLPKSVANAFPPRQNVLTYHPRVANSENPIPLHTPMSHADDEGPTPMHEVSLQEISRAGVVLLKYLILYVGVKRAHYAYKNELLKVQKLMPAVIKLEACQFDSYTSERERRLYKGLVEELKGLNLIGRSSNVKSSELLLDKTCKAMQGMVENLPLWQVYLLLDSLMQPEVAEYMAIPFLRDLFIFVSFVARKIRALPGRGQPVATQAIAPSQDPFTPNQRKMLEWQIKKYISLCSIQRKLTEESERNISSRLANNSLATTQNINQLPNYPPQINNSSQISSNNPTINKVNPNNLTVHQNIIIRSVPVDPKNIKVPSTLHTYNSSHNTNGGAANNNIYRIRLPYSVPYEVPVASNTNQVSLPVQEQRPQPSEQTNPQTSKNNTQTLINNPQTPINSAQTPNNSSETLISNPQTPINNIQIPNNSTQTLKNNPQITINNIQTPKNSTQTPINNPQTPINNPQTLIKNIQAPIKTPSSPVIAQATTELPLTTNKTEPADSPTITRSPQETKDAIQNESIVIKQEKEPSFLTDQEIETIDLTWIKDIDPKQIENDMEFITVKKEELPDDEEEEAGDNEEVFPTAHSPADSGISSPPIQVEYDESVFSNRSCICEKVAEYVCGCMMAMYCSVTCQLSDWKVHKDVCQKYKPKTNKPQQ